MAIWGAYALRFSAARTVPAVFGLPRIGMVLTQTTSPIGPGSFYPGLSDEEGQRRVIFYKRFIGDYQRDTNHLSILEHGVYALLLDNFYATGKPLPKDEPALARMLRAVTGDERKAIRSVLEQFWVEQDGGYVNSRALAEIVKADEYSRKQSDRAYTRWNKHASADANAMPAQSQRISTGNANHSHSHSHSQTPEPKPEPQPDSKKGVAVPRKFRAPEGAKRALTIPEDITLAFSHWDDLANEVGLKTVQKITSTRRKHMKARLADCGGLDGWKDALQKVRESSFLKGENNRGWQANIDFMLKESSFTRIMEGTYDHSGPRSNVDRARELFEEMEESNV